jgi:hypothetical protein
VEASKNYPAWSDEAVVRHYTTGRQAVDDLYDSERALLMPAVERCESVLDVGCAAGGFYRILQALKPGIRYTGLDTSAEMIETARRRYPEGRFAVSEGGSSYPDGAFDLVLCTGVLLHNPDYRPMLQSLYRTARRGCVIDLPRLVRQPCTVNLSTSYMILQRRFDGRVQGSRLKVQGKVLASNLEPRTSNPDDEASDTMAPYVLCQARSMFDFLLRGHQPRPAAVIAVGYDGQPDASAILPVRPVCYCVVYLAKGTPQTQRTRVLLDLPGDLTASLDLSGAERVLGGREAIPALIQEMHAFKVRGSRFKEAEVFGEEHSSLEPSTLNLERPGRRGVSIRRRKGRPT